jgi:hypothetical protein
MIFSTKNSTTTYFILFNFYFFVGLKSGKNLFSKVMLNFLAGLHTGCLKIREFRIQSVVGKDPVELEKYLEKKFALPEEDIRTLILFNT